MGRIGAKAQLVDAVARNQCPFGLQMLAVTPCARIVPNQARLKPFPGRRPNEGLTPETTCGLRQNMGAVCQKKEKESTHTPPLSIYSALGGLRQDPGHAA